MSLRPVVSVRLFAEEKCFGPGMATLLHKVEEHHSLRSAAMDMNMAYSKAWTMIKSSESQLGFRLLHTTTGGIKGGGASLTEEGRKLLTAFDAYVKAVKDASDALFEAYLGEYR